MDLTTLVLLAGSLLMSETRSPATHAATRSAVTVIAHRGDSKEAPENTLAAFRSAMTTGADYVELDARQSADGTLYCLHDETLDRTTNAVRVTGRTKVLLRQTPDARVAELDAGSWFAPRFAGERVPTLAAALDAIQAKSRTLLEHKDGPADAYLRLLQDKNLVGKLIVQSFKWDFLAELHRLEPRQPLAALGEKALDDAKWARLPVTGARIVAWRHNDLTAELVAELRDKGYRVWAWTADEPADWARLVAIGVEGIITNRPAALVRWLQQPATKPAP